MSRNEYMEYSNFNICEPECLQSLTSDLKIVQTRNEWICVVLNLSDIWRQELKNILFGSKFICHC
jgi:hypothetical protein